MWKRLLQVFGVVVIVVGCSSKFEPLSATVVQEYSIQIYGEVIFQELCGYAPLSVSVSSGNSTIKDEEWKQVKNGLFSLKKSTWENFLVAENIQKQAIPYIPADCPAGSGLGPNYTRGVTDVKFSQIGYNENYSQALVYIDLYCGEECGFGKYYLFKRTDNTWIIIDSAGTYAL